MTEHGSEVDSPAGRAGSGSPTDAGAEKHYRVLVVEDHRVVAEGLVMLLAEHPALDVVGWAGSVAQAGEMAAEHPVDVAVVDYWLPDGTGVDAIAAIRQHRPDLSAMFLSADDKRTKTAIRDGFGVDGTDFTYAVGKVVLYSPILDVTDGATVLKANAFQHISIADPKAAPYGAAGMAVLDALGLTDAVKSKIVTAENITQAQQFVDSGNAELGFVALSQVIGKPATQTWSPPQQDYPVIAQDAVLLKAGADNQAAKDFLDYLKSEEAVAVIRAAGYDVE